MEKEETMYSYVQDYLPLYQEYLDFYGTDEPFFDAIEEGYTRALTDENDIAEYENLDIDDFNFEDEDTEEQFEPLIDLLQRFRSELEDLDSRYEGDDIWNHDQASEYQQVQDKDYDYGGELAEYENDRIPQAQPIFFIFILAAKAIAIAAKAAAAAKGF
jgi:hypothetical protein